MIRTEWHKEALNPEDWIRLQRPGMRRAGIADIRNSQGVHFACQLSSVIGTFPCAILERVFEYCLKNLSSF